MTTSSRPDLPMVAAVVLSLVILGCFLFIPGDALDVTIIYQGF